MPPKKKAKISSHMYIEVNADSTQEIDEAPTPTSTPTPPRDRVTTHLPSALTGTSTSVGAESSSRSESENWPNLKRLLDTLAQAAATSGLGPVKRVTEGLVELTGLYEDAAQGRIEYADLRVQLECIFDELSHHLSSSPVITASIDNICWSIHKEIELVKIEHSRSKKGRRESPENDAYMVLECYQHILGHLKRLTRNANMSTWKIVDQIATENRLQKLAPSLWACYNSEKALELERRACTDGTRTNLLAQMYQWVTGRDTGNIFWMSGMAGTGKTTIAYSLCEQLDDKTNRMLCASFFCSRSLPECRDVGRIIPSIAFQLAQCSQPFRYALSQATEKEPLAHTRLPQLQFELLIVQPFSDPKVREAFPANMVVVIDALDECDDVKSTKHILDVLLTKTRGLPIKFVVSSRPEPAIRDQMEQNAAWVDARIVLHELDGGEVQTDIRTYLKAELDPVQPSNSEVKQLVDRAGVLFIYAATVVRYVGADNFKRNPRARLEKVLDLSTRQGKVQTKDIDQLYGAILDAANGDIDLEPTERDDMKLILDTVICAREPLTVNTLNKLLKLNDVDRVHAALRPLWSVLYVMGSSMTVTTLHASFPDYLLDPKRSGAWYCDAKTHHHLLAQRCFECIRDTKQQFNICRLGSSYLLDDEVEDLSERVQNFISTDLKYSCQYWCSHLEAAEPSPTIDLGRLLFQFLTTHLLLWMEVRNLTQTFPATVGELTAAKRWATQNSLTCDVADLLTDAWRFASTFVSTPICRSTPHLYTSMLALLPPYSPLRKYYLDRFHGLIGVKGSALERRKGVELAQWTLEFSVCCIACSPDGTRIAVGGSTDSYQSYDRLYLLDAFTGRILLDLSEGDQTQVLSIAFSPDCTRLVSGQLDGYIAIWDVATGQWVLSPFNAHDNMVDSILYSHDGSYIVSASSSSETIRIWDALTGKQALAPIIGYPDSVTCIAISSDDVLLVSGSGDGTIRVWDIQSSRLILGPMREQKDRISVVTFSPDDSYIVSGSRDGTMAVWDTRDGQIMYTYAGHPNEGVASISISPDGASIASVSSSNYNSVRIGDAASGKIVSQLGPFSNEADNGGLKRVIYSSDGTRIIFIGNRTIRLLDAQINVTASDPLPGHTMGITSIDISPNGQHVVSGSHDCSVCVWDLAEGVLVLGPLHGHTKWVHTVRFSTDGGRIISCSGDSTIRQWNAQSGAAYGALIRVAPGEYTLIVSIAYSPDNTYIVSLDVFGKLSVWNSSNGQSILGPVAAPSQFSGIQAYFSPDGATVSAGYPNGSIGVWDVRTRQMVSGQPPPGDHRGNATSLALSPNGLYYAQGFWDGKILVRSIDSGQHMPEGFQGHTYYVNSVGFSPDSTRLVSGAKDKVVYVWHVGSGQSVLGPLRGHLDEVTSVAFSPDGNYVVSASADMVIRVWDMQPKEYSSKSRYAKYADWVLNEDGWVLSGESQRLFWVPTDLRNALMSPRNTLLLSRDGYVHLDFDGVRIGEAWTECWRNN